MEKKRQNKNHEIIQYKHLLFACGKKIKGRSLYINNEIIYISYKQTYKRVKHTP